MCYIYISQRTMSTWSLHLCFSCEWDSCQSSTDRKLRTEIVTGPCQKHKYLIHNGNNHGYYESFKAWSWRSTPLVLLWPEGLYLASSTCVVSPFRFWCADIKYSVSKKIKHFSCFSLVCLTQNRTECTLIVTHWQHNGLCLSGLLCFLLLAYFPDLHGYGNQSAPPTWVTRSLDAYFSCLSSFTHSGDGPYKHPWSGTSSAGNPWRYGAQKALGGTLKETYLSHVSMSTIKNKQVVASCPVNILCLETYWQVDAPTRTVCW